MLSQVKQRGLITVMAVVALSVLMVPASAAEPEQSSIDQRLLEISRVEEVTYSGILGEPASTVTKRDLSVSESTDLSFTVEAPMEAATASCYWAQPTYRTYNGFGQTATISKYYIEWCGSGGVVTSVLTLTCSGSAAQGWEYRGCTKSRGSTGFSSVRVNGDWTYRFGCCGGYVYRYVDVTANHFHNGTYNGTWHAIQ